MKQLSENFSLREMTRSCTAQRKGIDNTPPPQAVEKMELLCQRILQPIRDRWCKPIIVGSGYRCAELNRAVGGVKNSDHLYGCAADIKTVEDTPAENSLLYALIKEMYADGELPRLKQCINEYGFDWLHVSVQDGRSQKYGQFIAIA